MSRRAMFLLLTLSVLAWGHPGSARASSQSGASADALVLASTSVLLLQSGATTTTLAIPGPGELFVTLTDLKFPTSFASLQYAVSNAVGTGNSIPTTAAGTTMTYDLTAPTTLYANVFATVGTGGAGLYNLTATFVSAVPLPGSIVSFMGGGLLLALLQLCGARRAQVRRRAAGCASDHSGIAAVPV